MASCPRPSRNTGPEACKRFPPHQASPTQPRGQPRTALLPRRKSTQERGVRSPASQRNRQETGPVTKVLPGARERNTQNPMHGLGLHYPESSVPQPHPGDAVPRGLGRLPAPHCGPSWYYSTQDTWYIPSIAHPLPGTTGPRIPSVPAHPGTTHPECSVSPLNYSTQNPRPPFSWYYSTQNPQRPFSWYYSIQNPWHARPSREYVPRILGVPAHLGATYPQSLACPHPWTIAPRILSAALYCNAQSFPGSQGPHYSNLVHW